MVLIWMRVTILGRAAAREGQALKNRNGKNALRCFALLLAVALLLGGTALAAQEETSLSLYRRHASDSTPFQATNLFPGDTLTKSYYIDVSYTGSLTLHFHADIRDGYEKLAEVLRCKVALRGGAVLYDGLMRDMPQSLDCALPTTDEGSAMVVYDITAYLDTSVGNDYMSQPLYADFRWWVATDSGDRADGTSGGVSGGKLTPKTGDAAQPLVWLSLAALSMAGCALVLKKRQGGAQ